MLARLNESAVTTLSCMHSLVNMHPV